MKDLSLHILDLVDNSLAASARRIAVRLNLDPRADLLTVVIEDDGEGMDETTLARALDPLFTTRSGTRTGMGLPLFAQASREAGGRLKLDSRPGGGTKVEATFRLSHPDCKPLGDVEGTIEALRASHPEIQIVFDRQGGIL